MFDWNVVIVCVNRFENWNDLMPNFQKQNIQHFASGYSVTVRCSYIPNVWHWHWTEITYFSSVVSTHPVNTIKSRDRWLKQQKKTRNWQNFHSVFFKAIWLKVQSSKRILMSWTLHWVDRDHAVTCWSLARYILSS